MHCRSCPGIEQSGRQDRELELIARRCFDDAGESYWKAVPLTAEIANAITRHEVRALQRDLDAAPSERE